MFYTGKLVLLWLKPVSLDLTVREARYTGKLQCTISNTRISIRVTPLHTPASMAYFKFVYLGF